VISAFDRSLEARALRHAAEEYAWRYGEPGTAVYRDARLRFQQRAHADVDIQGELPEPRVSNPDVIRVLNAAIERAMLIDGASMANAHLLDPQSGGLQIAAHSGFSTEFLEFFALVDDTASACGTALATGTPVWVADTTQSPIFAGTPALEVMLDARIRAVASVPVTSPTGRLIGMISTHHTRPTTWTDRRRQGLRSLADATGRLLDHFTPAMAEGPRELQLQPRSRALG
jgi:GAF domain-containing protein